MVVFNAVLNDHIFHNCIIKVSPGNIKLTGCDNYIKNQIMLHAHLHIYMLQEPLIYQ